MQRLIRYMRKVIPHNSPLRLWYTRAQQLWAYIRRNRYSTNNITLIGVTGTDGKTTTLEMMAHILQRHGVPYISSSSLEIKMNGRKLAESKRTTPPLKTLLGLLQKARDNNIRVVLVEVSSHALIQWRVLGLEFDAAILTNITHEHLNFHKTRERYAAAKKLLFTRHLKSDGIAILNAADEYGKRWLNNLSCKTLSYEQPSAKTTPRGTTFSYDKRVYNLPILGRYNAANALGAALALSSKIKSINTGNALGALDNFSGVPGRMQLIETPANHAAAVMVDFALTKRAMASALSTAKDLAKKGRVIVVFGATGGQHDTSVRPGVAESVSTWADIAIITDDEPYDGDPAEIRNELVRLVKEAGAKRDKKTEIYNIADRREALSKALSLAGKDDVVLASGMGHYTSRTVDGKELPWNDAEVITEELQRLWWYTVSICLVIF